MAVPRLSALLTARNMFNLQAVKAAASLHRIPGTQDRRNIKTSSTFNEKYYTPKHEWVNVEGGVATVGVSKYAADALGDVVYAQLPEPGDSVEMGNDCGALESVKAASEVYSPVSGKVVEKNEAVEDGPALINQSPEQDGWLYKIELSHPDQVQKLMNEKDYQTYLGTLGDEDH